MNVMLYAVLTTLLDSPNPAPQTPMYLALQSKFNINIHVWNVILTVLSRGGWITHTSETMSLTEEGREFAAKINAAIAN